ncbi:MAG: YdeI/OmpD-associated family protein [Fibrobacteria bacterium]
MVASGNAEAAGFRDASEWEEWLAKNHGLEAGLWLKIAKKGSGKIALGISDALDVALCYGWIDSQRKSFDHAFYLQRYSPRRPKSPWSRINVDRAEALTEAGRMREPGLAEIRAAKMDGRWKVAYEPQRNISVPPDFAAALAKRIKAKRAFGLLDKTGRYAVLLPLLKATTEAVRAERIKKAIAKLES